MLNNKIKALKNLVGNEEIKVNEYDNQIFETEYAEYYVLTNEEAQELYELMEKDLIEDLGLESFTPMAQEYIINNCLDIEWFNEGMHEYHEDYVDDMEEEELEEELDNYNVSTKEELIEEYDNQYKNGLDFYRELYDEEKIYKLMRDEDLLDIDKIIEYCQELDGRGHIIAAYDGEENIEVIDNIEYYIYRIN